LLKQYKIEFTNKCLIYHTGRIDRLKITIRKIWNRKIKSRKSKNAKEKIAKIKNKKITIRNFVVLGIGIVLVVSTIYILENRRKINNYTTLVVDYTDSSEMESDIVKMTQLSLLTTDKNGDIVYNGAASDISLKYDSSSDTTKVVINLSSKLSFSDGVKLTADDVVFSYYWLLDETGNRDSAVANLPIVGLEEYTYNSSNVEQILTAARAELDKPTDSTKTLIAKNVIAPFLTSQLEWVRTLYGVSEYADLTSKYPVAKDLFAYLYAPKEKYNSATHDEAAVLAEVISEYGYDYDSLGYAYTGDYDYFKKDALLQAIEVVSKTTNRGDSVSQVSGIKQVSDTSVEITIKGFDSSYIYDVCDIFVLPKHMYNSTLEVGSSIDCAVGAGKYTVSERTDNAVSLIANPKFYGTKPLNLNVRLDCSKIAENSYKLSYNTNAYGYVGFNVNNVNVNGDPLSKESCELRSNLSKAFTQDLPSDIVLSPAEYTIYIGADGTGNHPAMEAIKQAVTRLAVYHIKLNIKDVVDENVMWEAIDSGKAQMWCGVWNEKLTPQFTQKYYSTSINSHNASYNPYKIISADLDALIDEYNICKDKTDLRTKYEQIKSEIASYSIEQVLYNKSKTVYFSPMPKNAEKVFKNVNNKYDWINEIGNIKIVN